MAKHLADNFSQNKLDFDADCLTLFDFVLTA
jgi:hypothetical protein